MHNLPLKVTFISCFIATYRKEHPITFCFLVAGYTVSLRGIDRDIDPHALAAIIWKRQGTDLLENSPLSYVFILYSRDA